MNRVETRFVKCFQKIASLIPLSICRKFLTLSTKSKNAHISERFIFDQAQCLIDSPFIPIVAVPLLIRTRFRNFLHRRNSHSVYCSQTNSHYL